MTNDKYFDSILCIQCKKNYWSDKETKLCKKCTSNNFQSEKIKMLERAVLRR